MCIILFFVDFLLKQWGNIYHTVSILCYKLEWNFLCSRIIEIKVEIV